MPQINKLPKKEKSTQHNETPMRDLRLKAYNTTEWKKLRLSFIKEHPCCAECLKKGKVTPASMVHHLKSPFTGGKINYQLLLDPDNLESICGECHGKLHAEEQGHMSVEKTIKLLDELFNI